MRQFVLSRPITWARWLAVLLTGLYFVLGLSLLSLRYLVLPQVDHWRPEIAQHLSRALGVQVALGRLQVRWNGWNPELNVQGLALRDGADRQVMQAPFVQVRVNWQALLPGRQGALRLQVRGMDLDVERLADDRLSLLGVTFAWDEAAPAAVPAWLQWALSQPQIAFHDLNVRWHDRRLGAPVLTLSQVNAIWTYSTHGASLQAAARADTAGGVGLQFRARITDAAALFEGRWPEHGQAWLQLEHLQPRAWRPWWPALPAGWQHGTLDLQAWGQLTDQGPSLTFLGRVDALNWQADGTHMQAPRAAVWAHAPWRQWQALGSGMPTTQGVAFAARADGVRLEQASLFAEPLAVGWVALQGRVAHPGAWRVQLDQAHWRNTDVDAQAAGYWQAGGEAGETALDGTIARADLAALHRYLPLDVSADAREWLQAGLQAGQLVNGHWRLQGDLARFPFGEHPESGDFQVQGDFRGARIDLVPGLPAPAWPLLEIAAGSADLHRMDLRLQTPAARMAPVEGQVIALKDVRAHIPDLERDPVLSVSGQSAATGATYMALLQHSPLAEMLDGIFDEARATGDWQVPLALRVPLEHSLDTEVQGRVDLQGASLQFLPQAPVFQGLSGQLYFNENGVRIPRPIQGQLLGGGVQAQGNLGAKGDRGLAFRGRIGAAALAKFVAVPGMKRIAGTLDYQATLARAARGYVFDLTSDTTGLSLDFPAPLAKPAAQARTLKVRWSDEDPRDDALDVRYGDSLRVDLRHRRGQRSGPYFQQAAVGVGQAAALDSGLQIEMVYPLIDLDRWNRIVDEFSIERRGQTRRRAADPRPLWPDLAGLAIQADQLRLLGTRLDHAVVRVMRTPDERWSMNVRSTQTTGTLRWQERDGRVQGKMSARFARLSLGDDPGDRNTLLPEAEVDEDATFDDDLEIPGIVLQADEFRLYGRTVGALSLEGERDAAQHLWTLSRLRIGDAGTQLSGTGVWRLRGADRGLSLTAVIQTHDLGAWMNRAGWKNVLVGGTGDLKGQFQWHNLPWTHRKEDLQGKLQITLDKGRFPKLGSHSAKLLELLSLQSITRLTKLDSGLTGLLKEGVPFDQLRGDISLDQGKAQVHDYKLIGSVGTILLEGGIDIVQETLDLQAVVVPNLDVSGAALAAGIAINPVIGLGAFITQWLLKTPLAKVMTAHYWITGSWDDPKVRDVPVAAPAGGAAAARATK